MFAEDMFLQLLLQANLNLMEGDVSMLTTALYFVSDHLLAE